MRSEASTDVPVYLPPSLIFSLPLMTKSKQPRITGHLRQVSDMKGDSRTDKWEKITWSKQKLQGHDESYSPPFKTNNEQ